MISISSSKRCWAMVDLSALERNVARIRRQLVPGTKYIAVVKADAYGHGVSQVVPRLMQNFVDCFAVANVIEGANLRELGGGWPILVLSAILPDEDELIGEYNLTPTVSSVEEVERFNRLGMKMGKGISVQLKIDTGMGRLGVWHEKADEVYEKLRGAEFLELTGIYTHFASSDRDVMFTRYQRELFINVLKRLKGIDYEGMWVHADNSAGLDSYEKDGYLNTVRLGLIQFGILPNPESKIKELKTEPVLSLKTRVGLIKELPRGTSVSYGRTHFLQKDSRVAVLTAGYADGIPIAISNRGQVIIRGQRAPIIGRVTMDQTIVDITQCEGVKVGDEVTLIGKEGKEEITISEWSEWGNTIEWDVYCSITKRVPRLYTS